VSGERGATLQGETWFLLDEDLATIRPRGAHGQRRDRVATSATSGTELTVAGHNGVPHAHAHSDKGEGSRQVLGRWPVG
jgi:hypothetical protein